MRSKISAKSCDKSKSTSVCLVLKLDIVVQALTSPVIRFAVAFDGGGGGDRHLDAMLEEMLSYRLPVIVSCPCLLDLDEYLRRVHFAFGVRKNVISICEHILYLVENQWRN